MSAFAYFINELIAVAGQIGLAFFIVFVLPVIICFIFGIIKEINRHRRMNQPAKGRHFAKN